MFKQTDTMKQNTSHRNGIKKPRRNKYSLSEKMIVAIQQSYNIQDHKTLYDQVYISKGNKIILTLIIKDPAKLMLWLGDYLSKMCPNYENIQNLLLKNSMQYKSTSESADWATWFAKEQISNQKKILESFLKAPIYGTNHNLTSDVQVHQNQNVHKISIRNLLN